MTLTLDAQQAQDQIERLKVLSEQLKDSLKNVQERMGDRTKWLPDDTEKSLSKEAKTLQKQIKELNKQITDGEYMLDGVEERLKKMADYSYYNLKKLENVVKNALKNAQFNTDSYRQAAAWLQKVNDEMAKRRMDINNQETVADAKKVLKKPGNYSTAEIQNAIKTLTELQAITKHNKKEWDRLEESIQRGKDQLKAWTDAAKEAKANDRQANLTTLSTDALAEQKKYWQSMVDGAEQGSAALANYQGLLKQVVDEEQRRATIQAGSVMNNLAGSSVKEIEDAIKLTEQLRDAQSRGSADWATYNQQIENARKYLNDYAELAKRSQMEVQMLNVAKLSQKALEEQKKFWQEVVARTEATDPLMQRYVDLLKKANDEMNRRDEVNAMDVMNSLSSRSNKEIEDAIKIMQRLRDEQPFNNTLWKQYNTEIERAQKQLKSYEDQLKQTSMTARIANVTDASTASLDEQKKYWQTMIDGAEQSNTQLPQYIANLQRINDEEERRAKNSAQDIISRVNSGWDDTIKNTEEAVKQLKEYRKQLNTTDTTGLKQVDDAIDILNGKIAQSVEGYMSLQDALNSSSESAMQNFKGTIEELKKLKKALETLRKTSVDAGDEKGLKNIDDSLARVNTKIAEATGNIRDFDDFIDNLSSKSLAELEAAAKQLNEQLKHTAANSDEFVRRSADLRDVNERIQEINRSFRTQENVISRTAKRLAAYLAASFTLNKAISLTEQAIQANIELSDSFADIRKTTGLAEEEVRRLSSRINDIDTRTSMEELHQLAVVAGQIGLRSSNDILGFAKASNQINVALNELGAEGTSTLMKLAQLTGDVNMGVEKALLSIGSAINELSADSAATAGPIVDMMSRLGGIAQQSGITTAEMAAMGATFNALNQPIEMAGTSLNKFISTLVSDTEGVAYALNMDARMLKQLIQTGQTTEAMLQVFERMKSISKESSDGLAGLYLVMGDLGSEGARMSQILSSAAGSVEFMRAQVELSRDAFVEATSVTNEYNVKNENAMAFMKRTINLIKEVFVNGSAESGIARLMRTLHSFVKAIVEGGEKATWFKSILGAMVVVMFTASKGVNNLSRSFKAFWRNVEGATTATKLFNGTLKALGAVAKTMGVYLVATGIGMLIGYLIDMLTHTNRLTKAIAENNNELAVQSNRVAFLSSQLSKENLEEKKKLQYINELNKNYGQYLGFMLKHTDSTEKLQKATALLNAELRKQSALTTFNTIRESLDNNKASQIQTVYENLSSAVGKLSSYGKANIPGVSSLVQRMVEMQLTKPVENLTEVVKKELQLIEPDKDIEHAYVYVSEVVKAIKKLESINVEYNRSLESYMSLSSVTIEDSTKQSIEARKEMLDELKKEYDQLQAISTEGMNEEQQRDHYNRLLEKQAEYVKTSEELMKGYNEEAAKIDATKATDEQRRYLDDLKVKKEALIAQTQAVTAYSDQIKKQLNVLNDHWGKGPNLAQWRQALDEIASGADLSSESIDKLVKVYKQMQKESQKISDVNAYNEMFGTNFTSLDKAQLDIKAKAKIIKDRLAALGRGVTGDFLWGSDGSEREAKRKAKEEYQAALAAFEAYWNERETLLRQKSAEQLDTEAELNRKLERMNEEKWADQVQLYMKLLDDFYRQSTFNSSKYVGPLTNLDYFKDKDLDKLRVQLDKWGIAMEDGMKKKMTEVGVKLQQQLHKVRQEIEKLLLDNNFTEQVINQYLEAIDRLGLLYNVKTEDEQKRTREQSRLRLAVMRDFADESYNLDAAALRQRMEQQEIFAQWSKGRTAEEYEALLQMLRKYHDDAAEADRKAAERRKKIFDNSTKGVALEDSGKKLEEESGTEQEKWKRFEELDLVTGDVSRDVEIDLYKQKIALSAQYIEAIKKEMEAEKQKALQAVVNAEAELEARRTMGKDTADAEAALAAANQQYESLERQEMLMTQDARQKMTENTQHLNDLYMQSEQSKLTEMKKYTDAVVEFSGQMGEAAFGEVEDRKEAAKQLVKTLLTYLKDWAAVKLTELAMKQMFSQKSTAIEGQQVVSDLTMTGAKTAADIAAGGASATAKETAKLGFAGLAVGAVISAALGALLGLAMSALNKSKSTVQSVSGAGGGKLATGMLTYASGNYPVLGNDGNVYNAKYEGSNPQTGIYGGGAHFGIFSEKKPEAIIDGDTTHKLVTDYRGLWNAILTISRHGSLPVKGMPTFATGNIEQLIASATTGQSAAQPSQEQQQLTQATLAALTQTMQRTNAVMEYLAANGVGINMYSDKGLYKQSKKASKFAERVGL